MAVLILSPPFLTGKWLAIWSGCRMRWSLPVPALQQALFAQLEPARSAGAALHAVWSFTGPAGAVAEHTPVAVLVSVVSFRAAFHTGRVCGRRKECVLMESLTCGSHTSPLWARRYCMKSEMRSHG